MYIADTLSRATVIKEADDGEDLYDEKVVHGLEARDTLTIERGHCCRPGVARSV